jgi:hypothetical protein
LVRLQRRFFVPTCYPGDVARSRRQGWPSRRSFLNTAAARPRLDGGEHDVMLETERANSIAHNQSN